MRWFNITTCGPFLNLFRGCVRKARCGSSARRGSQACRRLALEPLEQRHMLAIVSWTGAGDGMNWSDTSNWSGNQLPGHDDDVKILTGGTTTIDVSSINAAIKSLESTHPIRIHSGGALAALNGVLMSDQLSLAGGAIIDTAVHFSDDTFQLIVEATSTLDGVWIDGDLSVYSTVYVHNGLTVDGTLSIGSANGAFYGMLYFADDTSQNQTLQGTATVVIRQGNITNSIRGPGTLTIGPDVTVHGRAGIYNDNENGKIVNHGTIIADDPYQGLAVGANGSFVNEGSLLATNGATLELQGSWTNAGTLTSTDSAVNLGGVFTLSSLGTFNRTGGTVNLTGTLDLLPVGPSDLLASAGADFIGLRWNDNSSVESGYRIERATDGVNFTFLANVPADVTTYIDTSVVSATAYSYRVRAYNAVGESLQYSNVAATQLGQLGPGVLVSYYNSPDLSGPVVLTQMPTTVDVGWGYYGSPGSGLSGGNFSGRWLGQLTASVSETFTFDADAYSTGTKVWVNDQLVYNNVDSESATNQLALLAGTKYDLKIEFRASYYYPRVRLFWSSPSTPSQIVPASALSLPPQSGLPLPANAVGPIVPVTGGGTLALNATTGDWNLAGGTIRGGTVTTSDGAQLHVTAHSGLDGVTLVNTTLDIPAGQIYVTHGLTLDGSDVRFNNTQYNGSGSPRLRFDGSQTLSGSGRVLFAGSYWGGEVTVQGGRLTIGPDVTLETAGFDGTFYDYGNGTIDNRGTIRADDGRTLNVNLPLNNRGTLQATSGGVLNVGNVASSAGQLLLGDNGSRITLDGNGYVLDQGVLAASGSTLTLNGRWSNPANTTIAVTDGALNLSNGGNPWTNAGTITATNSAVNLGGVFTLSSLGTFNRTGGTVNLTGTLDLLPVGPSDLLASAGADFIGLRWNDNSSVESGYRIERATDGVNFTFLANVPADVTTYIDTSVVSATAYSYRVRAYNAVGESLQYSNVAATQLGQLGPGVLVSYYNSPDLSGPVVLTQMPTTVDVGWGYYGSPGSGLSGGNFSGRWLGQLTASVSETFTFDADAYSTGTKVWVNDQLVYNNVDSESATNQLALLAGTKYDLKIEFRASYYYPRVRLFWSSPSTPSQIVPASALSLPPQSGLPLPANAVGPIVPVTGGGTLALNATTGDWNLAGGTIRGGTVTTSDGAQLHVTAHSGLDGVTLQDTTLDIPAGQIYVTHGLTLDGSDVRFNNTQYNGSGSPRLRFDGSQTLSGSGRVLFAGSNWGGEVTVQGGRLTIGPDVTLETAGFDGTFYDYGNGTIDNRGTIRADDGRTLNVNLPLNNRGTLQATSGGVLNVGNVASSAGQLLLGDNGSRITLDGNGYVLDQGVLAASGST